MDKKTLVNTNQVAEIFGCSRPTAYNIMAGKSSKIRTNRSHRVITVEDVLEILEAKEKELLERMEAEVSEPRTRLAALLSEEERPEGILS